MFFFRVFLSAFFCIIFFWAPFKRRRLECVCKKKHFAHFSPNWDKKVHKKKFLFLKYVGLKWKTFYTQIRKPFLYSNVIC